MLEFKPNTKVTFFGTFFHAYTQVFKLEFNSTKLSIESEPNENVDTFCTVF